MTNRFTEVLEKVSNIKGGVTKELLFLKDDKVSKLAEIRTHQFEGDRVFAKKRVSRRVQRDVLELVKETNDYYKKTVEQAQLDARAELVKEPVASLSQLEHDEFRNKLSSLSTRSQLGMDYKSVQKEINELVLAYQSDKKLMKQLRESYLTITGAPLGGATIQDKTRARLEFEKIEELSLSDLQIDAKRVVAMNPNCSIFKEGFIHAEMLKSTFDISSQMNSNPISSIAKLDEEKEAEDRKMKEMYA